jgi:hypothetical protein
MKSPKHSEGATAKGEHREQELEDALECTIKMDVSSLTSIIRHNSKSIKASTSDLSTFKTELKTLKDCKEDMQRSIRDCVEDIAQVRVHIRIARS